MVLPSATIGVSGGTADGGIADGGAADGGAADGGGLCEPSDGPAGGAIGVAIWVAIWVAIGGVICGASATTMDGVPVLNGRLEGLKTAVV
jgi:hypothetical protein